MKKRVGFAYGSSVVAAALAFALLMLKLFGPATRWIALGVYAIAWVLLVFAIRRHARALRQLDKGKGAARKAWSVWSQEIVTAALLVVLGALGLVLLPPTDIEFLTASVETTKQRVRADAARVKVATRGIARQASGFIELAGRADPTNLADKPALREAWSSYVDYAIELDQLIDVHEHFYQINPARARVERADSFVIAFAALARQLESGLAVREAMSRRTALVTLLNEASSEHGLPAQSYFVLSQGLLRADNLVRLQAGLAYLTVLKTQGRLVVDGERQLAEQARTSAVAALEALGSNADALVDHPLTFFETKAFAAWFPLQKRVANQLGNIRVQDRPYFVDAAKLAALRPKLEPMDVMLERRNWYLTNIGLPGFWPHAALFTGDLEQLDAHFDEALVSEKTRHGRLSEYLKAELPSVYQSLAEKDEYGDTKRVLEAIGEGVVFTSFEHSGNADYLAVLRPSLTPEQKLDALLRAFSHHEKPYDFDFDFVTDETIVCSELVYKSLQGLGPIQFELSPSAGRVVLTPNQIIEKFDRERGSKDPALSFVAFLDGSETDQTAHERDAAALGDSCRRPKWDIAQP